MRFRFFKNAAYLTLTGFVLRGLGMLFRIYISARIGEEGMGVYQLITSAYFLFITLAQSGLSVTVTRLCAERIAKCERGESVRVLKSAVAVALCTGTLAMLLMLTLSAPITKYWLADGRALLSLRTLALSLPFISTCSVLSGYFIADKNVINGCTAQIIEQISRLAAAAIALTLFSDRPLDILLAAVVFANTLSEALSCIFLALCFFFSKKSRAGGKGGYARQIISGAVPVALTRYLVSGLHTAENMLVPSAIALYTGSRSVALSQFGALKGMALPLLFFPFSLLSALSSLLLPEITESAAKGSAERTRAIVSRTCNITLTLSAMTGGVFFLFADGFAKLIYNSDSTALILKVLSPLVPFMYLDSICDGMLKGLGRQKQVFYNNCIDSALRILLVALLVPKFGLYGFLAMMAVSNITVSLLNFRQLLLASDTRNRLFSWWIKPALIVLLSAIITKFIAPFGATLPKILLGCALFCLIFGGFSILFGFENKKYKKYKKSL